jgi:hypothetical protein
MKIISLLSLAAAAATLARVVEKLKPNSLGRKQGMRFEMKPASVGIRELLSNCREEDINLKLITRGDEAARPKAAGLTVSNLGRQRSNDSPHRHTINAL